MKQVICLLFLCGFTISAYGVDVSASDKLSNEIPEIPEELKNSRAFEETIAGVFEQIRVILETGYPALGIPPLEVFEYAELNLNGLESSLLSGDLYLSNIVVKGITEFNGDGTVNLFTGTGQLNLEFPYLDLATEYNGKIKLFGMIDLQGTGDIKLVLSSIKLGVSLKLQILPNIQITEALVTIQLPSSSTATITGLFNDEFMSDIISRQLTDTLNALAVEESGRIGSLLTDLIMELIEKINKILVNTKTQELTEKEVYERLLPVAIEKAKQIYVSDMLLNKKLQ